MDKELFAALAPRNESQLSGEARFIQLRQQNQTVSEELERCRERFNEKVECMESRKKNLEIKEGEFKKSLKKYETYLKELEGKKDEAKSTKAEAVSTVHVKIKEINKLTKSLEGLKRRKEYLKDRVARGAKFEHFVNTVLSFKPDEFGDVKDILTRSGTLTNTREILQKKLTDGMEEKKRLNFELTKYQQRGTDETILLRMRQDELERQLQAVRETNRLKEKQCFKAEAHTNENQAMLGNIIRSSANMHILIQRYKSQPEEVKEITELFEDKESNTSKQLIKIHQYLEDLEDIMKGVGLAQ